MFEIGEPPAKVQKVNNEDDAATDASNLSDESAPETMDFPETTELPESMGIVESLSMDGAEMIEERLQDSFDSQEPPEGQESQEEWLNEDVLTDDDFNPAAETADSQASNSQPEPSPLSNDTTELEQTELEQIVPEMEPKPTEPDPTQPDRTEPESTETEQTEPVKTDLMAKQIEVKAAEQNIEDALNTLEGGFEKEVDLPDLDAFLIKKTDVKSEVTQAKTEDNKQEEDDGNDTDDLLRMLGEDGSKTKKLTKTVKDMRNNSKAEPPSSDDDDFVFEGSAMKLKLAKSVIKKEPVKVKLEDDGDITDQSSDEGSTMQKMFSSNNSKQKSLKQDVKPVLKQETHVKNILSVKERPKKDMLATSTPLRAAPRSLLRPARDPPVRTRTLYPPVQVKREPHPQTYSRQKPKLDAKATIPVTATIKTTSILKATLKQEPKKEPQDTVKEEKEEEVKDEKGKENERKEKEDLRTPEEEFDSEFEDDTLKRSLKPECMDEDVPSDAESHSEDGSLYDELPSSESENGDDWFQIDIRAEKAGDYLPLMGPKAKELLQAEKQRVSSKLANLKQSLAALTDSGKKQAEQVRTATMALAELDDMLRAS